MNTTYFWGWIAGLNEMIRITKDDPLVNKSGMYLNLEDDNGCLYFNVWNTHTWGEYTLYYFPVKFVEELNPTLRRIVITFSAVRVSSADNRAPRHRTGHSHST